MALLVASAHTIQVPQNVTAIANFNLVRYTDRDRTEHRTHAQRLAAQGLLGQESGGMGVNRAGP